MSHAAEPPRTRPPIRAGRCRSSHRDHRGPPPTATRCRRRGTPRLRLSGRPGPPRPATAGQPGTAHARRSAGVRQLRPRPGECERSGRQDLVEQCLGLVLVGLLGQRQFAHQDLPRLGEHPLLTCGQAAFPVPPPQVPNDLGDLVHVTGSELLQVGLVPPRPVGRLFRVRRAEHLEDTLKPLGADNITDAYQLGIIRGNAYGQVTLVDLKDQIGLILALNGASLDRFDASSPVMGIDDGIADLERHVASTPSAEDHLTTSNGVDKTPLVANMQVSTVVAGPYPYHSAAAPMSAQPVEVLQRYTQSTRASGTSLAPYRLACRAGPRWPGTALSPAAGAGWAPGPGAAC